MQKRIRAVSRESDNELGALANLRVLPLAHSQDEGILAECSFHFAGIDPVSQQIASVLVTRLSALKTDLGVGSQIQLFALPRELESVVPAPPPFGVTKRHKPLPTVILLS